MADDMRQGDTQEEERLPSRGTFEWEKTRKSVMNLTLKLKPFTRLDF